MYVCSCYESTLTCRFSAFADLFSEAVQRGLKGLKTQNAGLYYHQAALWAIQRKKVSEEMFIDLHSTQLLPALPQVNYYGQRPWRKNLTGIANVLISFTCAYRCVFMECMKITVGV